VSAPVPPVARRARFYRRRGFWIGSGLAVLGAVLLVLVLLYWLLQTVAGRDVLLAQVVARLPAGSVFTWEQADGPLAGPLTLRGVEFRYDKIHFTARRVLLDPDIRPLLGRKLRVDRLELEGATLDVPKSEEPFTLPTWPGSLPQISVPLAIQADTVVVDDVKVSQAGKPVIAIARLRGGVELADGELHAKGVDAQTDLGHFQVHGNYLPRRNYRADLTATAVLPAPRGTSPARFGLVARGDLDRMEVAVAGRAPQPLKATLGLVGGDTPTWTFKAVTEALDPALLIPGSTLAPVALDLQASGTGGDAQLHGRVSQGGTELVLDPSRIAIRDQVLTVAPLQLRAFDGQASLRGEADFSDPENTRFQFAINADGLRFAAHPDPATPQQAPVPVVVHDARLGVAGRLDAWAAVGHAAVEREQEQAKLEFDVRGNGEGARIHALRADMPGGSLQASGQVAWSPVLDWDLAADLDRFDPGYFAPGWDGRLSGHLASRGQQQPAAADGTPGGYVAQVALPRLSGQLRGRRLDAHGDFAWKVDQGEGALELALGGSRASVKGSVGARLDLAAHLQPLDLADLLPGASGSLRGDIQVRGAQDAPELIADLAGSGLAWNDWKAGQLSLRGRLPWRGSGGALELAGSDIVAGTAISHVDVQAHGAVEDLRLQGRVAADLGSVALSAQLRRQGTRWQGEVASLDLAPSKGAAWALRAPGRFVLDGDRFSLTDTCLGAATGGALCASADWPAKGVVVRGDALPLALAQPWLASSDGRQIYLRGELTLDGELRPAGSAYTGHLRAASMEGGVRMGDNTRGEVVRYDHFSLDAQLDPRHIHGKLGVGFQGNGFVDATVDTGWDAAAPLTGQLYMNSSRLYWLELFSPDLVRPQGLIEGHVSLAGTRAQPRLGGEATLSGFTGDFPSLGLTVTDGKARLLAQPDGSARIDGSLKSGEGTLNIDGSLSWYGQATPLQLNITGQNVLVSNTTELRAVANPDLQFGIVERTMRLRGKVTVPEADIDLERLDRGTSVSPDVVVLDPANPQEEPSSPLDMDLAVALGKDVKLTGFGLKGGLTGQIQVRSRPGYETTATGNLDVSGRYKAYGQDLTITRGQLTWSNNIVSDPRINMRAERQIADVTAGIDVTGRAMAPHASVWSNPSMSQSEAMSYLVLGRSLSSASDSESEQVSAASAALSAGSGLLASEIGAKLGLDEAGVSQSRSVGSVVGFGKYLTPKLYVGYGVSLVGSGSVLTLKYLLSRGFDIEVESSSVENRGSINWRREK
jgi:translocation and assembly module TamB